MIQRGVHGSNELAGEGGESSEAGGGEEQLGENTARTRSETKRNETKRAANSSNSMGPSRIVHVLYVHMMPATYDARVSVTPYQIQVHSGSGAQSLVEAEIA